MKFNKTKTKELIQALQQTEEDPVLHALEYYVDINCRDDMGNTVLMWACKNGYINLVRKLILTSDIAVNMVNHKGNTALIHACLNNQIDIVTLLLSSGVTHQFNLDIENEYGNTALDIAKDNSFAMYEILSEYRHRTGQNKSEDVLPTPEDTITDVLDRCKSIREDRRKEYGDLHAGFGGIADIWNMSLPAGTPEITKHRTAILMAGLKLQRLTTSMDRGQFHDDSFLDLINYLLLAFVLYKDSCVD